MSFFTAKTDQTAVAESGGSYISGSGIYDVTLKVVSVKANTKNARSLNFSVDLNGSEQVLYGLKLDNNDGSENYQARVFNKLVVCTGLDIVNEPEIQTHNLGKDKVPTDLSVLTDFDDIPVKVRVQFIYKRYEGKISVDKEIKSFYRADGASASEIINDGVIGTQLAKDAKYADNITYKDGLTAEDVAAWKKSLEDAKKSGKPAAQAQTPAANKFATGFPA